MSWRILMLLVTLMLVGIAGCSLLWHTDPFPIGACAPPCWLNLTPGQSTEADLDRLVASLSEKERSDVSEHYSDACAVAIRSVVWRSQDFRNGFTVEENGKLRESEIAPSFDLSLKQVVDRFGPPEYVDAALVEGPDIGPDNTVYFIDVYYPNKGLHFELRADVRDVGWIKPNAEVIRYFFSPPGDLETLFWPSTCGNTDEATFAKRLTAIMEVLKPWPGFGEVEVRKVR